MNRNLLSKKSIILFFVIFFITIFSIIYNNYKFIILNIPIFILINYFDYKIFTKNIKNKKLINTLKLEYILNIVIPCFMCVLPQLQKITKNFSYDLTRNIFYIFYAIIIINMLIMFVLNSHNSKKLKM